ncbi:MAG: thymidylate synthase [Clostridia bacterium]|nr:thymidylate synthase [Clostridia bacterium]
MTENNVLEVKNRKAFRAWLALHSSDEKGCWVALLRGRPTDPDAFYYLDAVEEALCYGWIDSTQKNVGGVRLQRFGPRKKNSPWTELNKERVRRLEKLGLMTDAGRAALPAMGARSFRVDPDIERALKKARVWTRFRSFPPLYQRVRAYNVAFYKKRDEGMYEKALAHLVEETKKGRLYGEWNDYGRLLDY